MVVRKGKGAVLIYHSPSSKGQTDADITSCWGRMGPQPFLPRARLAAKHLGTSQALCTYLPASHLVTGFI